MEVKKVEASRKETVFKDNTTYSHSIHLIYNLVSLPLQIQIIPENSFVIQNLEEKRVRIFVSREQTVVKTPHIGWQKK